MNTPQRNNSEDRPTPIPRDDESSAHGPDQLLALMQRVAANSAELVARVGHLEHGQRELYELLGQTLARDARQDREVTDVREELRQLSERAGQRAGSEAGGTAGGNAARRWAAVVSFILLVLAELARQGGVLPPAARAPESTSR